MPSLTWPTEAVARAFAARLGPEFSREAISTPLAHGEDGRWVAELRFRRLRGPGDDALFIAKRFALDTGERTFGAMTALQAAGPPAPPLAVPRALFYAADTRTLGLERAPGRPYRALVAEDGLRADLALAGAALAALQQLDVPALPAKRVGDHLAELMRPDPARLALELPEHGALIAQIVAALRERERAFEAGMPLAPSHRDFHLGQLFRDGDRVWLIDWDHVARADPALDLGNLAAYLRTRVPSVAEHAYEAFLDGYTERAGGAALDRVPPYEALTYLRLACKRFRLKASGWPEEVAAMLRRAGERLG